MTEEFSTHLEMLESNFRRSGMSEEEARHAARREFGGVDQAKEMYRDQRSFAFLEQFLQDTRYALRGLGRAKGFLAMATISLALGIGVNTTIFTLVNAIVLKNISVPHADRVVQIEQRILGPSGDFFGSFSYPFYRELRRRGEIFDGLIAAWSKPYGIREGGSERTIYALYVSGSYFSFTAARPYLGRLLDENDDSAEGASPVCVISYRLWSSMFGQDPRAIGRSIRLGDHRLEIVGVTGPGFAGTDLQREYDVEIPMSMTHYMGLMHRDSANVSWLWILARLKEGIRPETASDRLTVLGNQISEMMPKDAPNVGKSAFRAKPSPRGFDEFSTRLRAPLAVLMTTVALVLLVACLNLANLLLARGHRREREVALRLSLGASRWRILRQLMVENFYLAAAGGILGGVAAVALVRLLLREFNKGQVYEQLHVSTDQNVLWFALGLVILTMLAFGLVPAWLASGVSPHGALQGDGRGAMGTRPRSLLRRALITAQVALTVILVFGAALFGRSLRNLRTIDVGLQPEQLLLADLSLDSDTGNRLAPPDFTKEVVERLGQMPGVQSAAYGVPGILSGAMFGGTVQVVGRAESHTNDLTNYFSFVSPGYFRTVGIPVVAGREFDQTDRKGSQPVAIVNEEFVHVYFPKEDPVGKQFLGGFSGKEALTIVGVVKTMPYFELRQPDQVMVYQSASQYPQGWQVLHVRVRGNPQAFERQIRDLIHDAAPQMPLHEIRTMALVRDATIARERMLALVSTLFGILALSLSAVGLYGLISYSVAARTREVGIRISVGASQAGILRLFLQESLTLVAIGLAAGCLCSLAGARLLQSLLFGLQVEDPLTVGMTVATLMVTALVSTIVPAARATRIDPASALRHE